MRQRKALWVVQEHVTVCARTDAKVVKTPVLALAKVAAVVDVSDQASD